MNWTEKESINPSSEAFWESNGFYSTNLFASEVETLGGVNASAGNALSTMTMNMISELMSDYIPKSEQNMEMVAAGSQPNSSRASPDSKLKSQCKVMHGLLWKSLITVWMAGRTLIIGQLANQAPAKEQQRKTATSQLQ